MHATLEAAQDVQFLVFPNGASAVILLAQPWGVIISIYANLKPCQPLKG